MALKTVSKYANTVTSQKDPNVKNRTDWTKPENAIGWITTTSASAKFTKEKYATHYKTTYKKDKNGKEVAVKTADKWSYKYTHPYTLSGHDFRFELPNKALVRKVVFEVRMKASSSSIPRPRARFCLYGGAYKDKTDNTKSFKTGWNDGIYYVVPTKNLSTSFDTYTYTMDTKDTETANAKNPKYEATVFGIDLEFLDAFANDKADNKKGTVYVEWIRCTIDYVIPDCAVSISSPLDGTVSPQYGGTAQVEPVKKGTESDPHKAYANEKFPMEITLSNGSNLVEFGDVKMELDIPDGTELSDEYHSHGTFTNNTWNTQLKLKKNGERVLQFNLMSKRSGLNCLTIIRNNIHEHKYYYYVTPYDTGNGDGYSDIKISCPSELHQRHRACIDIVVSGYSNDNSFNLSIAKTNFMPNGLTLDTANSINIESFTETYNGYLVNLVNNGDYVLALNYCGYPTSQITTITVTNGDDPNNPVTERFLVKEAYSYIVSNTGNEPNDMSTKPDYIKINNHRIITDLETGSSIVPIVADEYDANMIMSECNLGMDKWDDLDYIGCIPLEQTHFDPKSTFKDTLLDTHYKNKRYMGKKLATDEDITLNVRLRPMQVTTLQGLIKMDKPIPINANHKCFESDALNHRGWAEIYGVKTEQTGNNPHWYKCDIDVKYLTHNLNTRFKIEKGDKSEEESFDIPNLMVETFSSGDNLSDDTDPYFNVDTDGTFYYNAEEVTLVEDFVDDNDNTITYTSSGSYSFVLNGISYSFDNITDVVDVLGSRGYDIVEPVLNEHIKYQVTESVPIFQRNNFNIDNGQHITITSNKPLTSNSIVDFTWSSQLISEYRENAISRIVRLIDKDNSNNVVFEYQYDDIQVVDDEVTATLIYRDSKTSYENTITFRYNPSDYTSETEDYVDDDDLSDDTGEAHYGTTLTLGYNNGKLSIRDAGFNGREFSDELVIGDGNYYYQVEWINNNSDDETSDIDCVFDFRVQDTILTSNFADKWGKLVVSPFPVADKPILFTRQAEEGSIYYYIDDGEEFSYLIEPYYQYLNGTDLQYNGSSIFDLNYGYEVVYIQNGLVRLGFNRLNGELYLGKYDNVSESYITVSRLHLSKFDDINLNSITDDKIEIQASDSTFTIWRGHPYIKVKHELEDLMIDTQYNTVWAEQVGKDNAIDLPAYWDLMNNKNLLPSSVGGNTTLKPSDVEIESYYVSDRTDTSLQLTTASTTDSNGDAVNYTFGTDKVIAYMNTPITFNVNDGGAVNYSDIIDLDDSTCSFGTISWSERCDESTPSAIPKLVASKEVIQTGEGVDLSAEVTNHCFIGVEGVRVDFYEVFSPSIVMGTDKPIIQSGEKSQIYGKVRDDDGSLVKGIRVDFYILEDD